MGLVDGERPLQRHGGVVGAPLRERDVPEAHEREGARGMVGAERPLVDGERSLVEQLRLRKRSGAFVYVGEVDEARRDVGMVGAGRGLTDRERRS